MDERGRISSGTSRAARQVGFFFDEEGFRGGDRIETNKSPDRDKRRTPLCEPNSLGLGAAARRTNDVKRTHTHARALARARAHTESILYSLLLETASK